MGRPDEDDYDSEDDDSDDTWESDLDSEAEIAELMQLDISEDAGNTGKQEYLAKCSELKIVPVAMFIAKLECEHINLRHHGMGIKGAISLSAALGVNTKIRSLNLGDNWFGDQGVAAVADVLKSNGTLTSINLSDNRVGLRGVHALCKGLAENNTLAELSLKGNALDDRAAPPLSEALQSSTSLTRVDLSYNHFGEESGRLFGEMIASNAYLLDLNLKWNSLRAKGGVAVAEALKSNGVLNKVDLGWNGMGDAGAAAISEMLEANSCLTHIDVSHNRIGLEGAVKLAEGIEKNHALMSLELGFNPMGMEGTKLNAKGIEAIVAALKSNENIETVGLSSVQSGAGFTRGRASRFDPKNPDGHYLLDLAQPWDYFIADTLYWRMTNEEGESWINQTLGGSSFELTKQTAKDEDWILPKKGVLEFDYVTWKRGLEATFTLDLSNPCDLFLGENILKRTQAAAGHGSDAGESCRECRLNEAPFEAGDELPSKGTLHVVYFSTKPQDTIEFPIQLNLGQPEDKVMCLRLWERALTTPSDSWTDAKLDGAAVTLSTWGYPDVPSEGTFTVTYSVRLLVKPYDRGVYFSTPMGAGMFKQLLDTLSSEALSDFDKVNLIKQVALRNYLTCVQVKSLLQSVQYRKGKLEVAVMLHPRTVDPHNFVNVLQALNSEADREAVLAQTRYERGGRSRRRRQ